MFKAIIAASMVSMVPSVAFSKTEPAPAWGQYKSYSPQPERQVVPRTRHVHIKRSSHHPLIPPEKTAPLTNFAQLQADVIALRRELAAIRAEVGRPAIEPSPLVRMLGFNSPLWDRNPPIEAPDLLSLPTLGLGSAPLEPSPLPSLGRIEGVDRVRLARLYLLQTASIGATMLRQTPEIALGRLHPDFAVRLADAIKKARQAGLVHCGVFSAYRPPAFGVGGFSDKFNSLHSYGLAADITGIGSPGSNAAHLWQNIVKTVGLFLPYGSNNRAEYNHTQLISAKMAEMRLRGTITASGPKDLERMWLASGVHEHIAPAAPTSSAHLLPENAF